MPAPLRKFGLSACLALCVMSYGANATAAAPWKRNLSNLLRELPSRRYSRAVEPIQKLADNTHAHPTMAHTIWALDIITRAPGLYRQHLVGSINHALAGDALRVRRLGFNLHAIAALHDQLQIPVRSLPQVEYERSAGGTRGRKIIAINGITDRNEVVFTHMISPSVDRHRRSMQRWRSDMRQLMPAVPRWAGMPVFLMLGNRFDEPYVSNFPSWQDAIGVSLTVGVLHSRTGDVQIVFPEIAPPVAGPDLPGLTQRPGSGPSLTEELWRERSAQFGNSKGDD